VSLLNTNDYFQVCLDGKCVIGKFIWFCHVKDQRRHLLLADFHCLLNCIVQH